MKSVRAYQGDPMTHFDAIVASKQKARSKPGAVAVPIDRKKVLKATRRYVDDRYKEYAAERPHLDQMVSEVGIMFPEEAEALLHCYVGETEALSALQKAIDDVQKDLAVCPYCGIGELDTWDHYLPKETFPELSVLADNLVRCCFTCNNKKGTVLVENGERTIIHFYFDAIDQEQPLLRAEVTIDGGRLSARFSVVDEVAGLSSYARLFHHHCRRLGLLERYKERARVVVGDIENEVKVWAGGGTVDVNRIAQHVAERAEHFERAEGTNSWKAALWGAMARAHGVLAILVGAAAEGAPTAV